MLNNGCRGRLLYLIKCIIAGSRNFVHNQQMVLPFSHGWNRHLSRKAVYSKWVLEYPIGCNRAATRELCRIMYVSGIGML